MRVPNPNSYLSAFSNLRVNFDSVVPSFDLPDLTGLPLALILFASTTFWKGCLVRTERYKYRWAARSLVLENTFDSHFILTPTLSWNQYRWLPP